MIDLVTLQAEIALIDHVTLEALIALIDLTLKAIVFPIKVVKY